jgi:hypothetical protein
MNRQFQASSSNALWVANFTQVAKWRGFVYIVLIIDTFARHITVAPALRARFASLKGANRLNNLRLPNRIGTIPLAEAEARHYAQTEEVAIMA